VIYRFDDGKENNMSLTFKDDIYNSPVSLPGDVDKLFYSIYAMDTVGNLEATQELSVDLPEGGTEVDKSEPSTGFHYWTVYLIIILLIIIIIIVIIVVTRKRKKEEPGIQDEYLEESYEE
jgi:hypothetical protein